MDRSEFESLVRKQWAQIREVARRFDPGPEVDDICQEVVLIAWRRRDTLYDSNGFGAWARSIALNVGRAHARRRERWLGPLQEGDCVSADPSSDIVDRQALETALAALTSRERETVEAHYLRERSLAEIAFSFQEPVGTTKSRLSRARGKLRRNLRNLGWTRFGRNEEEE